MDEQWMSLLATGAVLGAITVRLAFWAERHTKRILVGVLLFAAAAYVYFSVDAGMGTAWLLLELVGVGVYGAMALRSLRGSSWWLVAGWALHPVWDIAVHHVGPGRSFAPDWWTVPCLSWDLVTAGYIAFRIARGWTGGPVLAPRPAS